jgi:hypothetical protein
MDQTRDMEANGPFDARYLASLETITQLRPVCIGTVLG